MTESKPRPKPNPPLDSRRHPDFRIAHTIVQENDPPQLSAIEFGRLQVALGAAEPPGLEGAPLEGAIPYFADHQISEYIRLLQELRDRPSS
jgi:hypothetical protein